MSGLPREQVISALTKGAGVRVFRVTEDTIEIVKEGQLHRTMVLRPTVERPLVERLAKDYGVALADFAPPVLHSPKGALTMNGGINDIMPADRLCKTCGGTAHTCAQAKPTDTMRVYDLQCQKGHSWSAEMPLH